MMLISQAPSPTGHDPRVIKIVRRHTHDVRNYINSLDLEATLLEEIVTDEEGIESVRRMRDQLTQLEATVRALSSKFAEPQPTPLTSTDLFRMWQLQIAPLMDVSRRLEWQAPNEIAVLTIDANAILSVLRELVLDAWKRAPASTPKAAILVHPGQVIAELREVGHVPPGAEEWIMDHAHLVTLNGGTLRYVPNSESGEAITTLSFPQTLE